ncbi:hypothetical protein NP493_691g02053 [Ridgeia piscesae]|uniref:Uncharacterized protein n=1 Tax=Ridgeia piscesae TaxID=27915 RepID=A0AAD9KR70_RIDPI|nr:hypothetical protein NP493_691g02053 [Ridgeia piscesae]
MKCCAQYVIVTLLLLSSSVTSSYTVDRQNYDDKPCPCVDNCRGSMRQCLEDNTGLVDYLKLSLPKPCYTFINDCLENCLQNKY